MPCYHPIAALQPTAGGPLLFPQRGTEYLYNDYRTLSIACGQCHGCKLSNSREWAIRCLHEKQLYQYNSYITLTYKDQYLREHNALHYPDFVKFMKRLRQSAFRARTGSPLLVSFRREATQHITERISNGPKSTNQEKTGPVCREKQIPRHENDNGTKVPTIYELLHTIRQATTPSLSFYMAGEYGKIHGRPHYHAILFGIDFRDRKYHSTTPSGAKIYTSSTLQRLWPFGYSSIGDVTFESAAYVARYIMKKYTGDNAGRGIQEILDPETGEIIRRPKEFNQMSRNPAIGKHWLLRYTSDVYTTGKVRVRGHQHYPPRYYDKLFRKIDQAALEEFQYARYLEQLAQTEHHSPERLAVQEQVAKAKTRSLQRRQPWQS